MSISGTISAENITGSITASTVTNTLLLGTTVDFLNKKIINYMPLSGGSFTGHVLFSDTNFDDMQFPSTRAKKGVNDKPDFDFTNIGLLFPQNDETEYIILSEQFSHSRKYGTNISPHIHYIQDEVAVPVFVLSYRWYDNGNIIPNYTNIETTVPVFDYEGSPILQILPFPDIDGSNINFVSSWFEAKLYRKTGDGVTGDILVKSFDIHFEIDSIGSDQMYIK